MIPVLLHRLDRDRFLLCKTFEEFLMKKQVHPAVIVIVIVALVGVLGFVFYKSTATPPPQGLGAGGPGMAALKKNGGDMSKFMTPEEKAMMQRSTGGQSGK
jgi:hypothetical protein